MQIKFSHLLYKNIRLFIFLIVLSIVGGILIKYLMPDRYVSYAEVYANQSNSLAESIDNPDFGYEIHADRLKQILESQPVRDSIIRKFDLYSYYGVDSADSESVYEVNKAMDRDFNFQRNSNMAVVIIATTNDPNLSANIVNYILTIIDPIYNDILKYNTSRAVAYYSEKVRQVEGRVDSLLNSIYQIKKPENGSLDPLANRRLQEIHMRRTWNSATPADARIMELVGYSLSKEDQLLIDKYVFEYENLKKLRQDYSNAVIKLQAPIPAVNIISRAKPSPDSTSPGAMVYIGILLGVGFLGCIVILFIRQRIHEIKSEL